MKPPYILFIIIYLFFSCSSTNKDSNTDKEKYQTIGTIERLDVELNSIIPEDAKIEVIGSGMVWSEGPLWVEEKGWLLCSDVKENRIHKWSEEEGFVPYLEPSGFTGDSTDSREKGSNGLTLDYNGNLVMCHHGDRRVARMHANLDDPKPIFETLVDSYNGMKLNSPNDLTYDRQGYLYFTDPPFGLSEKMMDDPKKELSFQGIYRLTPEGVLTMLSAEMSRPNGIALSPDEKTLYVSNADIKNAIWMAYPIKENGDLGEGSIIYDATSLTTTEVGVPDGIKVNSKGYIFTAGPGGLWIFNPSGKLIGKVRPGEWVSNCAFDTNESTLYITADNFLLRIKLN